VGATVLSRKLRRYRPRIVAVLGVTAYRIAFQTPTAKVGPQTETLEASKLWVLPNPSGLNAHYQVADLGKMFAELHNVVMRNNTTTLRE
jgi:TDG/mug DNA glycosylase family protein